MCKILDAILLIIIAIIFSPVTLGILIYYKLKRKPRKISKEKLIRRIKDEMCSM